MRRDDSSQLNEGPWDPERLEQFWDAALTRLKQHIEGQKARWSQTRHRRDRSCDHRLNRNGATDQRAEPADF
jgi:hypothetical protein